MRNYAKQYVNRTETETKEISIKGLKNYFWITLLISILVAIILPLAITGKPTDWDWFFYIMAMSFTLVWAVYAIVLLITTFFGRGRLRIKVIRGKNPTIVRYELPESKRKE